MGEWQRPQFVRDERGSVILETALLITVLLMLMFGMVDLGRALFTANNLVSAARESARFGAIDPNVNLCPTTCAAMDTAVAHFSPFGGAALRRDSVHVTPTTASGAPAVQSVRVTINYPFRWITPIPRLLGWTSGSSFTTTLHGQAEYRYEF